MEFYYILRMPEGKHQIIVPRFMVFLTEQGKLQSSKKGMEAR